MAENWVNYPTRQFRVKFVSSESLIKNLYRTSKYYKSWFYVRDYDLINAIESIEANSNLEICMN